MNNNPPTSEAIVPGSGAPTRGWTNWFNQVSRAIGWKRATNTTATLNFGSVGAAAEASLTVTVMGARAGDAVQVTANNVAGIVFSGVVTANDTVRVYAKNYTAGAVDPPSQVFRIIVLQD